MAVLTRQSSSSLSCLIAWHAAACLLLAATAAAQYEDSRCKCICPTDSGAGGANGSSSPTPSRRRIWITTVPFGECTCERVVDPLPPKAAEFCLRCQCKSETRSTAIQKVVVVLVLCIICSLCLYMLFLSILQPLLLKARLQQRQHHDILREQQDADSVGNADAAAAAAGASAEQVAGVVNRARDRQERWTRAVEVQRQRVYNQHSMLN